MIQDIQPTLFRDVERTPRIPADITANRHRNSPASVEANPSQEAKSEMHKRILAYINFIGKSWLHDLCREFNKPPNEISPRITELLATKPPKLERIPGERIEKCSVLRIKR